MASRCSTNEEGFGNTSLHTTLSKHMIYLMENLFAVDSISYLGYPNQSNSIQDQDRVIDKEVAAIIMVEAIFNAPHLTQGRSLKTITNWYQI